VISLDEPTTRIAVIDQFTLRRNRTRDQGPFTPFVLTAWGLVAAALLLWTYALGHADLTRIDGYGLLPALPVTWYLALALLVVTGAVVALVNAGRSTLLTTTVVAIIMVVHATPALLYGIPRYTWTFKHIGVTNVILAEHAAPRAADIYFDWPGFFTAAGWLSQATGISLADLATWSPPFFNIAFAAAVSFVARGLTKDLRIVWLTTLLFVITNWVGQDYFAPQAYAFTATLVLTGLLLRTTPMAGAAGVGRLRRLIGGRRDEDVTGIYGVFSELNIGTAARTVTAAILWLAVITSHQLSPVFALLTTVGIGAARGHIRWRLLAFMVLTELAWVAYGYPYLNHNGFTLFDFNPLHTSVSGSGIDPDVALPGMQLRSYAVYALYFGMFALGVASGLLRVRRGRIDIAPVLIAVAPITMLAMQNYGGEGQLRIYLFALPYLAFLVAWLVTTVWQYRVPDPRPRAAVAALLACVCTAPFLLSYYGQEKVNLVRPDDVQPVAWLYGHAPVGEWMCFVAPNFPSRMTANYVDFPIRSDSSPNLMSSPDFLARPSIKEAVRFLDDLGGTPYLVFSPSQQGYLEYFGLMTPAAYEALERSAATTPRLRLVYRSGEASVWQLRPRH
jgi:hypothetical protein